ncbi:collagen-like protein [Ancylomarina sp. DW003]|nr:collagen-like protein [Ancylomarina sp. DW003]MDE5420976.1 collagen-like protein [Ancylomarina sp. DW003]
MKRKQLKFWFLLLTFGAIFAACEGPAGKDGANGADGADGLNGADGASGNATCMSCHAGETKSNIEAQFAMSGHDAGKAVGYSDYGPHCSKCHSHQGFVQLATLGTVGSINNPTAWECSTCHGLHKTMEAVDYALRLSDPVTSMANEAITLDMDGNSNLCANCHQSRKTYPMVDEGETHYMVPKHFGPHHGPQANILYGTGLAEITGDVAYPEDGSAKHLDQASCTGCHMADYDTDNTQGGHSFIPSQKACNDCHGTTDSDFEHNGARADFEVKLVNLRDELIRLGLVTGNDTDGYHAVEEASFPILQAQATFNWIALNEDSSHGAHNPVYINAILMNSIKAMEAEATPAP